MAEIRDLLHASIVVADTRRSLDFYEGVLGMQAHPSRPDLGYPGAWLRAGPRELHLLELPNPDPTEGRPAHGGRDRHVAFAIASLDGLVAALDRAGVDYTLSRSGRRALFCRDPDGNALEFIETAVD